MKDLDIKEIWKSGDGKERFEYSEEAIQAIIKQGPQNIVSRFVKTLNFEKWANLIVLSAASVFLFIETYWVFGVFMLILDFCFYFYYRNLIKKLDQKSIGNNVVQYLHEVHGNICRFIRHFKITLFVIAVASFAFGFYQGYSKYEGVEDMMSHVSIYRWVAAFSVIAVSLVVAYFVFYYMYGKKAKQIKEMIESLDEMG
ncbi:hypothetical protein [Reichenbachiella ulvae]|uniref:DUF3278 domain-containing protein n=1 Tax=Reichenbachiella ulvae TaxID=2980104 RepID=A0ABT3D055_9BACT|nr:hypothetical protein [Reichenbachiella ulvae]MCV9388843.1 hypothetical protein [Reichenbachiella ulvae]